MSDSDNKRCSDYAEAGIVISADCGTHANDCIVWHIERAGRRLFSSHRHAEVAMFAEELYERIKSVQRPKLEPYEIVLKGF